MCGGEGFCAQDPRKGGPVGSQLTGLEPRKATCREACRGDGVGGASGTGRWERAKGTKWGAVGDPPEESTGPTIGWSDAESSPPSRVERRERGQF